MSSDQVHYPVGVSGLIMFKPDVSIKYVVPFLDTVWEKVRELGATPLVPACVSLPEVFLTFSIDDEKSAETLKETLNDLAHSSAICEAGGFSVTPITLVRRIEEK